MSDWVTLEEMHISSENNCISVDTRDFHCICHKIDFVKGEGSYYEKFNHLIDLINENNIPYESIIDETEIVGFINKMKSIRDEANVIMLRFNNVVGGFSWIKYIRFYRIGNTSKFIVTNNCTPLYWKQIEKEKLIKLF